MIKLIIAFGIGYIVGVFSIALAMSGYDNNRRKGN